MPKLVLHQLTRARTCPNPSPFCLKLETYLRVTGIDYDVDFKKPFSAKGKTPWMTFDGKAVADSQICIETLQKRFPETALDTTLSDAEKAVAKSFQSLLEDHLYFCVLYYRWIDSDLTYVRKKQFGPLPGPKFANGAVIKLFARGIKKQTAAQGMGRHSAEEIYAFAEKDLKAVSDFLGDKTYSMGNEPGVVDCVLFAFVVIGTFGFEPEAPPRRILDHFPNLTSHMKRMKEKFYPDWDECKYIK